MCSDKGVKLPWDEVGASMREGVTGGAIIQHISKLRQRLEATEKDVPPPPRRGGAHGNSTSRGRNTRIGTPAASTLTALRRKRASANVGSETKASESEDEDFDVDRASDAEEEFGSRRAGHKTTKTKEREPKAEKTYEGEIKQEDQNTTVNTGKKRKRAGGSHSPLTRNKRPSGRNIDQRKTKQSNRRARSSESSGEDTNSGEESPKSDDDENQQESVGRQYLAVGADFFEDYDQDGGSPPDASSRGESSVANQVVVLRLGESKRAKAFLQQVQSQERAGCGTDAESVAYSGTTSVAKFDGGKENIRRGNEATSNLADVDYHSVPLQNSQLSQDFAQRLPQRRLPHASGSLVGNPNYSSIELGDDSFLRENNATHNSPFFPNHNFPASRGWELESTPADLIPMNFAAPVEYSAHMNQQSDSGAFGSSNLYSDNFHFPSDYANNLVRGSAWNAPSAFDHGSAIIASPDYVALTVISENDAETGPVSYANSFSRSQVASGRYNSQVHSSAAVSGGYLAEASVNAFPAAGPFSPDNSSTIQASGVENPEEVIWTDYLAEFQEPEDISDAN